MNNEAEAAIFIYRKGEEIKILNLENAAEFEKQSDRKDWNHTSTLNPVQFLKHISKLSDKKIIQEIKNL